MNAPVQSPNESSPHWNQEKTFYQKDQYFSEMLALIQNAKRTIELETYIFQYDRIGISVLNALKEAAARNVIVRVVVDGCGSRLWLDDIHTHLAGSRVRLKVYHPFPFAPKWSVQGSKLELLARAFFQSNKRLHRKFCFVDHETVLIGSFNICDQPNRDTGVTVQGYQTKMFLASFEKLWTHRWRAWLNLPKETALVQLNDTQKLRHYWNRYKTRRISSAQNRIWIESAYFVPPLNLLQAICESAKRGVDTRLIIPARSDHFFMKLLSLAFYKTLLLSGVRIFEYQPEFLHAKVLIIDEKVTVGSSNMNHRSLLHDLEVDVALNQPASLASLKEQFEIDLKNSTEITLQSLKRGSFFAWILQHILWLFKSLV